MNTVLRASGAAEFLALVPTLAGYTPRRSVALLPFTGTRTHGVMRIDLPPEDADTAAFADALLRLLCRVPETDAVAIVLYTDEPAVQTHDGVLLPHLELVDDLIDSAEDARLRIVDAFCVTPDGWSNYLDDDPELRPLDEIPPTPEVPGLTPLAPDQDAGALLPTADLAEKERVARALRDLDRLACGVSADGAGGRAGEGTRGGSGGRAGGRDAAGGAAIGADSDAAADLIDDLPALFEAVIERPDHPDRAAIIALLFCLCRPVLRDVAIVQWASDRAGGERALAVQLGLRTGAEAAETLLQLSEIMVGTAPRPDVDRLRAALEVVRRAAAVAPRAKRPGPLSVAAWIAWALGHSSHAAHYLELARSIDPDYGLAGLVHEIISRGMLPEWAFVRR